MTQMSSLKMVNIILGIRGELRSYPVSGQRVSKL